jgi:hypothetical protein
LIARASQGTRGSVSPFVLVTAGRKDLTGPVASSFTTVVARCSKKTNSAIPPASRGTSKVERCEEENLKDFHVVLRLLSILLFD